MAKSMSSETLFGIDHLLNSPDLLAHLKKHRVALVAHPASVTSKLIHSLDALYQGGVPLTCAFGPQHGLRGEKQDNMIESDDYFDPHVQIPVYSLYGKVRRPTSESMEKFDICLFDLQDVGTRIYTFLTTLRYMMEACAHHQRELWILDRPNPAGRPIEGMCLESGWESFVGAGRFPMRHGMTLGECALWLKNELHLKINMSVVQMQNYHPGRIHEWGWPQYWTWVNPSPNASNVSMTRAFPGTVMIEGTTLSEGRGTTHPLELLGAPNLDIQRILKNMNSMAPQWLEGCRLRPCYFEPTFHKHQNKLCEGFQIHVDGNCYKHDLFKPYRLVSLFFKSLRLEYSDYPIWRDFPYEYETERRAIDVINGGPRLREWVDSPQSTISDFEQWNRKDEESWNIERQEYLLY